MQSVNNKGLVEELEKLLERLRIPQEVWFRLQRERISISRSELMMPNIILFH
jgi:hypothetical protein